MGNDGVHDSFFGTDLEGALREVSGESDPLRRAEALRRRLGPELGRRAAELLDLRLRTKGRFEEDWLPYLDAKGAEQASAQRVAEARAVEIRAVLGPSHIWDATCGLGADSRACAQNGHRVVASDHTWETARLARANLAPEIAAGRALVVRADALRPPVRARVLLLDPDRRPTGARERDPERWSPPLSHALELAARFPAACVKLPPVLDLASVPLPEARLVWIGLGGELREVSLWTGELAPQPGAREAWALGAAGQREVLSGRPHPAEVLARHEVRAATWIGDPDPAVVRSGLLGALAERLGLRTLDPHLAFLATCAADPPPATPWLKPYPVVGCVPLDRKKVRALLARHDIGPVEVVKRGHPEPAERLARRFSGAGRRRGVLLVARLEDGHVAYLSVPRSDGPRNRGSESPVPDRETPLGVNPEGAGGR